jgi:hypothetical protein
MCWTTLYLPLSTQVGLLSDRSHVTPPAAHHIIIILFLTRVICYFNTFKIRVLTQNGLL